MIRLLLETVRPTLDDLRGGGEDEGEIDPIGPILRAVTSRIFFASPDEEDLQGWVADRPV